MSKLIVNEIEKYDAGQLTITTGTNVSIGSNLTVGGIIAGSFSVSDITTAINSISATQLSDITSVGSGSIITTVERDKLAGIEDGAEVNTVDSVNTQTGVVVLDADDIDDTSTTNKFTNQTDIDKLAGIEALADVTDATNVAAAGALMDGVAVLADLADVASTAPSDGQVLTYDTVNGWQPETPSGGGTIDGSGTADYITKWSDSDTLTDSVIYEDSGNIGIGTSSPDGTLHVHTGSAGTVSAESAADNLVVENSGDGGISILTPDANFSKITFGSPTKNEGAILRYNQASTTMTIGTEIASGLLQFRTGGGIEAMRIDSSGNVGIGTSSPAAKLGVNGTIAVRGGNAWADDSGTLQLNFTTNNGVISTYFDNHKLTLGSGVSYKNRIEIEGHNSGDGAIKLYTGSGGVATERMRITSGGGLIVKSQDGVQTMEVYGSMSSTNYAFRVNGSANCNGVGTGHSTAASLMWMNRDSGSLRSINAAGSINASGADYAEYMTKAVDDVINKGDVVGIDANGLLTNIFDDAISFVVKSTNPSYVGGDDWFTEEHPKKKEEQTEEEYEAILADFKKRQEAARAKVDRIAFSGQVPCNVYGASVGDYIVPINDNGKISGQAVSNPSFDQYKLSVGKVWKIMEDGRAWIAVKIG